MKYVGSMGIAQIALDPPLCQTGKREKSAQNHAGKPLHPPPHGQCQYGGNTFQKGASLIWSILHIPLKVDKNEAH